MRTCFLYWLSNTKSRYVVSFGPNHSTEMRHAVSPPSPLAQHIVHLFALLGAQEGRVLGTKASASFAFWRLGRVN